MYYTQRQSDRLRRCSCSDEYGSPGGLVSWDYGRSHQCTVLYEPGSDTHLGGSVLDMAEDLLQSIVSRGDQSA